MEQVLDTPDLVIQNGTVIDPLNNLNELLDVAIKNGKILAVGKKLKFLDEPTEVFDASGCLVTPGLIDMHVHVYQYATPLGVNADETCLSRGVTTVVDAGSAGASTFPGLRKYVAEKSKTRILSFVHIASHGLSASGCCKEGSGGECDSLNQVNSLMCTECITANRDMAVGVKVRLAKFVTNDGVYEEESYRRALAASASARVPLMVHHAFSTVPTQDCSGSTGGLSCPGGLRQGDIFTHCFHSFPSTIINPETNTLYPTVLSARQRGVLFDLGHGRGSFSWTVAELCAKQDFWPDIISTDLHMDCKDGPAYDLPLVMTKMLHVGMSLFDVIKAVTMAPAVAIGWSPVIGSLSVNQSADVTVLKLEPCDFHLEDSQGQVRRIRERLVPCAVWRDGNHGDVTHPGPIPGPGSKSVEQSWDMSLVRDKVRPADL